MGMFGHLTQPLDPRYPKSVRDYVFDEDKPLNARLQGNGIGISAGQSLGPVNFDFNGVIGKNLQPNYASINANAPFLGGNLSLSGSANNNGSHLTLDQLRAAYDHKLLGGNFNLSATADHNLRLSNIEAAYNRGGASYGLGYSPNGRSISFNAMIPFK